MAQGSASKVCVDDAEFFPFLIMIQHFVSFSRFCKYKVATANAQLIEPHTILCIVLLICITLRLMNFLSEMSMLKAALVRSSC